MDGCWRESGEGDWEAGVAGVMGLAVEIGRIGRVRWGWPCRSGGLGDGVGELTGFGHISLNRVWFMRRLNLLPILPISTAKHNAEQPCLLSEMML